MDAIQNCSHCGKKLKRANAAFCTNCGTPLKAETGEAIATIHGGSLAKLIVQLQGEESREEFLSKASTSLGRSRANMIQVLSPIVSGQHAQIDLTRQGHTITDLNSTNGTFVNGHRLKPGRPHLLASNDIIRFSDSLGNSASITYIAPSGFSDILEIDSSKIFQLTGGISYIGRNPEAAISLDHPAISWNHAKVVKSGDGRFTIEDLSSNNGTFVNGSQLKQRRLHPLTRGDVIQIGPFNLVYQEGGKFAPYSAERNFRLEAVDLAKTVQTTNAFGSKAKSITILQDMNLVINPREFVALVGGSGTGKSTLLKALSGIGPASSGTVLVNGDNLYLNFNLYRTMMGYVPQDDIIHDGLKVKQALFYAAQLRLPDANRTEIETRIDDVLDKVGMTAQADTMIRDLSGGQRKRVSIAVELLAEPWIFFLDEPTSGLDPGLEKLMMDTLRQLADEGRTIILVTHATTNIINNCDQVAIMAKGGQLAYFGPPDEALAFFNVDDFADIYTRLSQSFNGDGSAPIPEELKDEYDAAVRQQPNNGPSPILGGSLWASHYKKSAHYHKFVANRQSGEVARPIAATGNLTSVGMGGQLKQFGVLARRYLNLIRHDKLSLWVLLAVMPLIGIFLLLITDGAALVGNAPAEILSRLETDGAYTIVGQAQTLLFMMALAASLLGVFAASFEIIKEAPIYRRERLVNVKIPAYFSSKFVVLGLFMVAQCLLLLMVLALKIGYPGPGAMLWALPEYFITLVLTALAGVALGLFISALASSRDMVIYLVLIVLFIQIAFSGAIFELPLIAKPVSWLTPTRWSLEALGSSTNMDALNELGQVRVEREVDLGRGKQKVTEDVATTINFNINYTHSGLALLARWIFLVTHIVLWSSLALWLIKRKDQI